MALLPGREDRQKVFTLLRVYVFTLLRVYVFTLLRVYVLVRVCDVCTYYTDILQHIHTYTRKHLNTYIKLIGFVIFGKIIFEK